MNVSAQNEGGGCVKRKAKRGGEKREEGEGEKKRKDYEKCERVKKEPDKSGEELEDIGKDEHGKEKEPMAILEDMLNHLPKDSRDNVQKCSTIVQLMKICEGELKAKSDSRGSLKKKRRVPKNIRERQIKKGEKY